MSNVTIYKKVSDITGYTPNEIAVIQQNVAKGTSATELAYFLNVCKTMKLNPFNKEVWCYNLLIFAGRDGFLSRAQQNPHYKGIRSCEVRANDEWSLDIANNKIKHIIDKPSKDRGAIIGAYCIVFRKDGEPTVEFADFATYNKGYSAWKTHPAEMIKKVAESHALKKAFGISGIQSEYDFDVNNKGIAKPIETEKIGFDSKEVQEALNKMDNKDDVLNYGMEILEDFNGTDQELAVLINKKIQDLENPIPKDPFQTKEMQEAFVEKPKKTKAKV